MRISFPNNLKNLDPSYTMDLDFLECFGRRILILWLNYTRLIFDIFVVILESYTTILYMIKYGILTNELDTFGHNLDS